MGMPPLVMEEQGLKDSSWREEESWEDLQAAPTLSPYWSQTGQAAAL